MLNWGLFGDHGGRAVVDEGGGGHEHEDDRLDPPLDVRVEQEGGAEGDHQQDAGLARLRSHEPEQAEHLDDTGLDLVDPHPRRVELGHHGGDPHHGADGVLLVDAPLCGQEVQGDRVLDGQDGEDGRTPQVDSERLTGPAVVGDDPSDECAPGQVGESVEPLDDVAAEGVDHDHQQQDRLVPHDPTQEPLQIPGPGPVDVEEADHGGHEDQQVGHAQIRGGAPDTLDQDGSGQHEYGHQDRVGDEDAEPQHHQGHGESGHRTDGHGDTGRGGQGGDQQPGQRRSHARARSASGPSDAGACRWHPDRVRGLRDGDGAHRVGGRSVIGLGWGGGDSADAASMVVAGPRTGGPTSPESGIDIGTRRRHLKVSCDSDEARSDPAPPPGRKAVPAGSGPNTRTTTGAERSRVSGREDDVA